MTIHVGEATAVAPIKGLSHVTIEVNPCPDHAPVSAAA